MKSNLEIKEGEDIFGKANPIQIITYSWATPLVKLMAKKEVVLKELWKLREKDKAKVLIEKMRLAWDNELLLPASKRNFRVCFFIIVLLFLSVINHYNILECVVQCSEMGVFI